jgi:hypothetical protein
LVKLFPRRLNRRPVDFDAVVFAGRDEFFDARAVVHLEGGGGHPLVVKRPAVVTEFDASQAGGGFEKVEGEVDETREFP